MPTRSIPAALDIGVPKTEVVTCTGELRSFAVGRTTTYEWGRLREDLAPGTYRFRTTVEIAPESSTLHIISNVFTVTE